MMVFWDCSCCILTLSSCKNTKWTGVVLQLRFGKWGNAGKALHFDSHLCQPGPARALPFVTDTGRVAQKMVQCPLVSHNEIICNCTAGTTLRVTQRPLVAANIMSFWPGWGCQNPGQKSQQNTLFVHDLLLNYFTVYRQTPVANL